MKPMLQRVLPLLLSLCLLLSGCSGIPSFADLAAAETASSSVSLENIPAYTGSPYVVLEENQPDFSPDELTEESFESYSSLDSLGRCGPAVACIGKDLMPQEERESISEVKPSGWQNEAYDFVEGGYVYNRCHLIGFQLTGENANEENLITGTRYMNVEGMLPFENMVADYILETDHHVLYRVSPVFEGENLVASGVVMEAYSVEDDGEGICFHVFVYNVQPGVEIDYATGENWESGEEVLSSTESQAEEEEAETYVLNTNTRKFHRPDCSSVSEMREENRQEFYGTREQLIEDGYEPCGSCKP